MWRMKRLGSITAKFRLSQLVVFGWLFLNGLVLLSLQQNLKNHYQIKELALEVIANTQLTARALSSGSAEEDNLSQRYAELRILAQGGIMPGTNQVVPALPETVALRCESLQHTLRVLVQKPTPHNLNSLLGECQLLKAGFGQYAEQANDSCSWGLSLLALANLAFLLVAFRLGYTQIVNKIRRVQQGIAKPAPIEVDTAAADDLDQLTLDLNLIKEEIGQATAVVHSTGEGNFGAIKTDNRHPLTHPLFGALLTMQQKMQEVAQADLQRNWTSHGLARFVDILRSKDDDLDALANTIIAELVKYLKSNQGAIYLAETSDKGKTVLKQQACYAFGRRKWLDQEILPGEGLIGQAYLEKSTVYLTEVPKQYINITSGLGDAPPTSVIIVPLVINEEVLGLVELASFQYYAPHEIQFIEKLGENIAATLASVRNSQQTRRLLEESQLMAENLRAQEEEMRQNMEELTATQEEMTRKETELNGHLTAINNTLATIEFSLEGKVLTANQNFLLAMGYRLEEIQQNHHRMFCTAEFAQSDEYTAFWTSFKQGKAQQGEFLRVTKQGEKIWLRASYTPVMDSHGKPVKVIKCAFNITEEKNRELEIQGQLTAVNNTLAAIEFTMEGTVLQANEQFLAVTGYALEEIEYRHHRMFCEEEYAQSEDYAAFWQALRAGQRQEGEFLRVTKAGKDIWLKATYTPVLDRQGNPIKVIKYAFDITQAKQQELDRSAQLEAINLSNLKLELKPDGAITDANEQLVRVLGISLEELVGNSFGNLLANDNEMQEQFVADWQKLSEGVCFTGVYALVTKTNAQVWISATYSPVVSHKGVIEKIIIIGQDITQQKQLEDKTAQQLAQMQAQEEGLQETMGQMQAQEEELRKNMEEMQSIQEELHQKMLQNEELTREMNARIAALDEAAILSESDLYGNIIYANQKFCDTSGYTVEELLNQPHSKVRHPDTPKDVFKQLWATVKKGEVFKGRYPNLAKDGSTYWVDATIVPVLNEKGKPQKYIGIRFLVDQKEEQIVKVHQAAAAK